MHLAAVLARLLRRPRWTRKKIRAELVRWARDVVRSPTAQETGLPGARVPYSVIQRELGRW
jgi:hypothetical protein